MQNTVLFSKQTDTSLGEQGEGGAGEGEGHYIHGWKNVVHIKNDHNSYLPRLHHICMCQIQTMMITTWVIFTQLTENEQKLKDMNVR